MRRLWFALAMLGGALLVGLRDFVAAGFGLPMLGIGLCYAGVLVAAWALQVQVDRAWVLRGSDHD